jgi:hypothetical protein
MKRARIEAICEYAGIELPGRVVLKYGEHYFTVPQEVVQAVWEDSDYKPDTDNREKG